jgi:hypothetical protein
MATFSNNAETGASKDVLAENQEYGGSFDEKGNPVPPLDPAKAKEDAHTIRDCDSFAVNKA